MFYCWLFVCKPPPVRYREAVALWEEKVDLNKHKKFISRQTMDGSEFDFFFLQLLLLFSVGESINSRKRRKKAIHNVKWMEKVGKMRNSRRCSMKIKIVFLFLWVAVPFLDWFNFGSVYSEVNSALKLSQLKTKLSRGVCEMSAGWGGNLHTRLIKSSWRRLVRARGENFAQFSSRCCILIR